MTRQTLTAALLAGSMLLLPAAEWFSIGGLETGLASPRLITGAIGLAVVLGPVTFVAVILERRRVIGAVPLLVVALALWIVVANLGRPTYTSESIREAFYFGLICLTAFFAMYLSAVTQPARFGRWIVGVLILMVVVGVGSAWLERFSLYQTAEGIGDRFEPIWSFFRPSIVNFSPVLGPVNVIQLHSIVGGTVVRPAGFFATANAFADFMAIGFPLVAIISLTKLPKSPLIGVLLLALLVGLLQAIVWTSSRIGLAALGLELVAIPTVMARIYGWRKRTALLVAGTLAISLVVFVMSDANLRARITATFFPGSGGDVSQSERGIFDSTTFTTRGHIEIQIAAARMIFFDPQGLLRGPGKFEFLRAIHDPASAYYLDDLIGLGEGGPHSAVLTFGVGGGLPAMLLFLAIAILTVVRSLEPVRQGRHDRSGAVLAGLGLGFVGWLVIGTVDTNPTLFPEAMAIFTLIGAVNGVSAAHQSKPNAS